MDLCPPRPASRQWLAIRRARRLRGADHAGPDGGGPYPHDRGQRLLLAFVVCGPVLLLRRWPLPVLAAATAANAMVTAAGNAPCRSASCSGSRRTSPPRACRDGCRSLPPSASAAALGGALVYAALTARHAARRRRGRGELPAAGGGLVHRRQRARRAGATWPGWPSRPSGREPPRPNAPASRSARSVFASPASCTTSWPTPSR